MFSCRWQRSILQTFIYWQVRPSSPFVFLSRVRVLVRSSFLLYLAAAEADVPCSGDGGLPPGGLGEDRPAVEPLHQPIRPVLGHADLCSATMVVQVTAFRERKQSRAHPVRGGFLSPPFFFHEENSDAENFLRSRTMMRGAVSAGAREARGRARRL